MRDSSFHTTHQDTIIMHILTLMMMHQDQQPVVGKPLIKCMRSLQQYASL